ncbi:hypothetical protein BaRGS_00040199 [Batillaria attramentaria]|uniref:Uncharacterized protein n=1 Tax=Batillaria attramentaria TaxID=370345 RepID=A0ABD0J1K1_9CAEN
MLSGGVQKLLLTYSLINSQPPFQLHLCPIGFLINSLQRLMAGAIADHSRPLSHRGLTVQSNSCAQNSAVPSLARNGQLVLATQGRASNANMCSLELRCFLS